MAGSASSTVQNRLVALIFLTQGLAAPAAGQASARARRAVRAASGRPTRCFARRYNLGVFHYIRGEFSVVRELGEQLLPSASAARQPRMADLRTRARRAWRSCTPGSCVPRASRLAQAQRGRRGARPDPEVARVFHSRCIRWSWRCSGRPRCAWMLGEAARGAGVPRREPRHGGTCRASAHDGDGAVSAKPSRRPRRRRDRVLTAVRAGDCLLRRHGLAAWVRLASDAAGVGDL